MAEVVPQGVHHCWVDGSLTRAACVFSEKGKRVEHKVFPMPLGITANMGEYWAIIFGLRECAKRGYRRVEILSDSQLCVRQLNGQYKVKEPRLRELWNQVEDLSKEFYSVYFHWVPREENLAGKLLG